MSRKLLFEDASIEQRDLAIKVRSRLLLDLVNNEYEDVFESSTINYKQFNKQDIYDYLVKEDDVIFFIENRQIKTYTVLVNLLLKMNRNY
ncbi:hypothetical protein I4131_12455 [Staphylococcus aureus]|nr:hypothetical protein [Staphylococcus aureus]